ncbi:helix-turn-helix domain-containing protein [Nitrosomonas sp. Nm34]|uniref:helix-turn-helix domain-containing protein n=1 Tax=Nitrosomonas sp. Nm34 TaxID=1881055 RepID=UPI0008E7B0CF|nr:helix-turn-helix domain-containing protein [Nitrosomonas sp. Nm34]SFJ06934.1 Helix-turn-helix [Nitrosomonas sp. Nm34]
MNWAKLIQNLIDQGLTQVQIAKKCGTGQSYISGLLKGDRKSPNWALGETLRRLHSEVCCCEHEAAPIERRRCDRRRESDRRQS